MPDRERKRHSWLSRGGGGGGRGNGHGVLLCKDLRTKQNKQKKTVQETGIYRQIKAQQRKASMANRHARYKQKKKAGTTSCTQLWISSNYKTKLHKHVQSSPHPVISVQSESQASVNTRRTNTGNRFKTDKEVDLQTQKHI